MSAPDGLESLDDMLRARGIIAADAPPFAIESVHRPWFVALMLGIAGWVAGILLLGFIGVALDTDSRVTIFVVGLILLVSAWALYYADRNAVFLDQLALALSIAGQCAVAVATLEDVRSNFTIAAALLALQLAVLTLMPNRTARTLAALFATMAWVYTVRFAMFSGHGDDFIFDSGKDLARFGSGSVAIAWLVTWVPLLLLTGWLIRHEADWMASRLRVFARPILTGTLLGLAVGGVITEPFAMLALGIQGLGFGYSWQAIFPLLSIALAMYAAWCAFRLRSAGLSGFAMFAALVHLGRFYYLYGTSLLWKSVIMLCLGAVLLAAGELLRRRQSAGAFA